MEGNKLDIAIVFIGGLAMFIYGMQTMATGLQKYAGSKMKKLLGILTKNRFTSVAAGTVVTGIIQSSSATTVMIVGFVNAGIMNLTQACGVIMGANIGTTVTSWLVSSVEWASYLNPAKLAPLFLAVGVIMFMFCKKDKTKKMGEIIAGFALLFIGMETMSSSVGDLKELDVFGDLFVTLGSNPLLGILAGTAITAIIQSSSASVGILQSLAAVGLIPFNSAVYIIMGQNIGTCITALLSSIGTSKNAKCAAYIHLLFNIIGTVVFSIIAIIVFTFFDNSGFGSTPINRTDISIIHTIFNIACVVMLFPIPNVLINTAKKIAGVTDEDEAKPYVVHLDDRILDTPAFALEAANNEVAHMGSIVLDTLKAAKKSLIELDKESSEYVFQKEAIIDDLDTEITEYLVKLCKKEISVFENEAITSLIQIVSDFERVGDHCENIAESADFLIEEDGLLTESAVTELVNIFDHTIKCFETVLVTFENRDLVSAGKVIEEETIVDELVIKYRASHIKRLTLNHCEPRSGVAFLDTLTNVERITDHSRNIAEAVIETKEDKKLKNVGKLSE